MKFFKSITTVILLFLTLTSCGIYSFTGSSLSPDIKTITIETFPNLAPDVVPTLSASFTDALKEKFNKQTKLNEVRENGDIQFSGEIKGFDVSPVAITGDEVASKNRLTIRVRVKFVNKIEEKQSFDREFSAYEDFAGEKSIESVRDELIDLITETLVENIFNASAAIWD